MESSTTSSEFDPFDLKPDISASSKKLYLYNLFKLNDKKPIKNLNFLSKKDLPERLAELKPNTRRTYLIAIVSCLKGRAGKFEKLYQKFYATLMDLNKELKDNTEKTPKVKENWIEQNQVSEKLEELKGILPDISAKKKITADEYQRLLNLVVLSLYALQAPRRNKDYTDMMIVKKTPEDTDHNYLNITEWKWIFNNYKTQKKYAQQVIDVPDDLKNVLEVYLRFHPQAKDIKKKTVCVSFLESYDGSPIATSTEMTRMLNKIFGKRIGCSMLRAIFLTDKFGKSSQDLKDTTQSMGTSIETAQTNYIKQ